MNGIPRTSLVLVGVLALCGLLLGWLAWTRVQTGRSAEELLRHAPANAQMYAFLDVQLLRRTGVLDRLAGARGSEEADYLRFVTQSGFDYRQHLDGVVMAKRGTAQYAVIAGQFDAPKLQAYAKANAGSCTGGYCYVPGTPPLSFAAIRTGMYAFASGSGDARELLPTHGAPVKGEFLGAPIWATGLGPAEVPVLQALPGTERLSVWVTPRLPATIDLRFTVEARDAKSATKAAGDLEMLASRFVKEGKFVAEGNRVNGQLPLGMDFLEALASGKALR